MKKKIAVLFLVFSVVFISCDQDFNTIGTDLVGDEHFDFSTHQPSLKAYSVPTGNVQTNNLPINPLGFYKNPFFGDTKANFVTQLGLTTTQPKFGTSVQIENVTLYVPYFSTEGAKDSDGETAYTLDSIYGADKESKMKLSVYENGYSINSFDETDGFQTAQRYYSDGSTSSTVIDFETLKLGHNNIDGGPGTNRLNDSPNTEENDQFFFNKKEIVIYKTKFNTGTGEIEYIDSNNQVTTDPTKYVVKERLSPGIYLTLNKKYFKKRILDASTGNYFNNNIFRQYFKGLYFKMEQNAGVDGAMAMLNFNKGKLNVNYSSINEGATGAAAVPTSKSFTMNLGSSVGGNTISLQEFAPSTNYSTGLGLSTQTGNDANLFVKGGNGSVVYMDVFGDDKEHGDDGDANDDDGINDDVSDPSYNNGIPDELDELRLKGWLINDAYLEFYIDNSKMPNNAKYEVAERLYLFDATNQKPLVDYSYDTSASANTKRSKYIYGGVIQREKTGDKKGIKYRIRITQHINNLINSKNEDLKKNVKLGLCVTENIALSGNYYYKVPKAFDIGPDIKYFPIASVLAQQGVVLHGTASADEDKKLKLTIHYTKPN